MMRCAACLVHKQWPISEVVIEESCQSVIRHQSSIRNACKTPFNFIDVRIALNSEGKDCETKGILWGKVCDNVIKISMHNGMK